MQKTLNGEVLKEFGSARAVVEYILAEYSQTRDYSDDRFKWFVLCWCKDNGIHIPTETIRRTRQKVQNTDAKYQPSEEVRAMREERAKTIGHVIKYI